MSSYKMFLAILCLQSIGIQSVTSSLLYDAIQFLDPIGSLKTLLKLKEQLPIPFLEIVPDHEDDHEDTGPPLPPEPQNPAQNSQNSHQNSHQNSQQGWSAQTESPNPAPLSVIHLHHINFKFNPSNSNQKPTTVDLFSKENLWGKPKRLTLQGNKCMDVPTFDSPRSLRTSGCVMVYPKDSCWGRGVRIAGSVRELRSAGFDRGISSFRPCEGSIRIQFGGQRQEQRH